MTIGTTLTFDMPQGWTLRKVATALAREWLPAFRAEPAVKGAAWMVQPIVEDPEEAAAPLWEPGISTEEYEERLDQAHLCWAIRAKAGRGKGTVLARLELCEDNPNQFKLISSREAFPDTLFDPEKLSQFQESHVAAQADGLFAGLLIEHGFKPVTVES